MPTTMTRTTLSLPTKLLEQADRAVSERKASSRNELMAIALANELRAMQRRAIDEEFAKMAGDEAYKLEALQIVREFAVSDWEALRKGERRRTHRARRK